MLPRLLWSHSRVREVVRGVYVGRRRPRPGPLWCPGPKLALFFISSKIKITRSLRRRGAHHAYIMRTKRRAHKTKSIREDVHCSQERGDSFIFSYKIVTLHYNHNWRSCGQTLAPDNKSLTRKQPIHKKKKPEHYQEYKSRQPSQLRPRAKKVVRTEQMY